MYQPHWAFVINVTNSSLVSMAIASAPAYDFKVASAIRRTVEMIHGLQDLHRDTPLQQVEVYLDRSSYSEDHLLNRWHDHWTNQDRKSVV